MFGNIEFNESAFKHGISEDDIYWAFFHQFHSCYDGPIEEMENKFLRLGFDKSGNLLEIVYSQ